MDAIKVRITGEPGAHIPEYKSVGSAGADICAFLEKPLVLLPGQRLSVPTGLRLEIPEGWEAQVRPRSGLALEFGITCLNSPGTIDSDYRGELLVLLVNFGSDAFTVHGGDRIAQLVLSPVSRALFEPSTALKLSERGSGGFGSTGRR